MRDVVQANARGTLLSVSAATANRPVVTEKIFVKIVDAVTYGRKKSWIDLRRTLVYARTEARFYSEFLPALRRRLAETDGVGRNHLGWMLAPTCHHVSCCLGDLVPEDERPEATPDPSFPVPPLDTLRGVGARIVLRAATPDAWTQASPLAPGLAGRCLRALAQFHAASAGDSTLLHRAADRLGRHGGSHHLSVRNSSELEGIERSWEKFAGEFAGVAPPGFFEELRSFGTRIGAIAAWASDRLSPSPDDARATIVHGDYKAMNVFLPVDDGHGDGLPIMIDFASAGVGNGMSDVAMHITHAVVPTDLAGKGEARLVDVYLEELHTSRGHYNDAAAHRDYRIACVDYCRFVLGRFWAKASIKSFKKNAENQNVTLVNRSWEAAEAFIRRVEDYMSEFELELCK